jgi:flagellar hook protein FlgE
MSFQQGLSGLDAASQSLDVIGNNIANSNTAGFKSSTAEFADVYANNVNGTSANQIGIGTQLADVAQQFTQGNITTTNNPLDLAINGNGFFVMSQNGAQSYTRDGQFQINQSGFLTNAAGYQVLGYQANASGQIVPSAPSAIQIPTTGLPATATTAATLQLNLNSGSNVPATGTFSITDPTSYNNSTSETVYDSLGNSHTVSTYFVQTSTPNQWDMYASVDGTPVANVDLGGGAGNPVTLTFNSAGQLQTTMPMNIAVDLAGVATANSTVNGATTPFDFTLNMTGTTQFGSAFVVNSETQDGYTSGQLASTSISSNGVIQGSYTNGQTLNLGQVVLADFANPAGLAENSGDQWTQTLASGQPLIETPGAGSTGSIQSGAIESSNVDLTAQLVDLITEQRAYQANAQTIKTQDTVLQTLVSLD